MRLIDAGVLLENMNQLIKGYGVIFSPNSDILCGCIMALDRTKRIVEDAHTIDPESLRSQWIPVKERLPEEKGKYIVTACDDIWNSTVVMVAEYYSGSRTWYDECCECSLEGIVTAWMPLPEPYTAKAEDDDNARRVNPLEFDRFKNDMLKDAQPTAPAHWEKADIPLPYQVRTIPMPNGTFTHREMYVCSACDGYNDRNTQYCPHCGAKMDKEANEK